MVRCGEPGCAVEFRTGRARRRHVHTVHRTLPYTCAQCNYEPFLTEGALRQHENSGHMNLNKKPRKSRRSRRKKTIASSIGVSNVASFIERSPSPFIERSPSLQRVLYDVFDARTSTDLNKFIASKVQPDYYFLDSCSRAVDEVVTFLQHNAPGSLRPTEVIKGGSLCKGTAVTGKSDADLVVLIKGYTDVQDLKNHMSSVLSKLKDSLRSCPNIQVIGSTHRAVKVKISKMGNTIEADILPAIDLSVTSASSRNQVYKKMERASSPTRAYYSPCLAPLQKKLFEGIPTEVKSLIRLIKYWKKEELQGNDPNTKWPTSYPLELITIDRWMKAGERVQFDMTRGLHSVLTSLKHHRDYRMTFQGRRFYDAEFLNTDRTPYIMDPCNPFNNVYYKGAYDWDATALKAAQWLGKPLFAGCSATTYQW